MLEFLLGFIIGMLAMYVLGEYGLSIELEYSAKKRGQNKTNRKNKLVR